MPRAAVAVAAVTGGTVDMAARAVELVTTAPIRFASRLGIGRPSCE
jgi:hypothetical protein